MLSSASDRIEPAAVNRTASLRNAFEATGFFVLDGLVAAQELEGLRIEVDRLLSDSPERGGVRNLLAKSSTLRELATSGPPADAAAELLGPGARPRKLTVFDKTPRSNWKVPWHQDLTIAVRERREVAGFGPWSVKDGLPHVQPPAALLEQIVALRLHLDDTPAGNGALRVLAGTHKLGRLSAARVAALRQQISETVCPVAAGGAMLMSPLLLHASSPSHAPSRRRVLHFEYSAADLPAGLAWAEFADVSVHSTKAP